MSETVETTTFTIETADGDTDEVTLPTDLVALLAEDGQQLSETVADITLLSFANRAHHIVHHSEGANEDLEAVEAAAMDLFEERFGVTFAEATGHHH